MLNTNPRLPIRPSRPVPLLGAMVTFILLLTGLGVPTVQGQIIDISPVGGQTLAVNEGRSRTYRVRFLSAPDDTLTVRPSASNNKVTITPSSLSWSGSDWGTYKTFTVTAVQDADLRDETVVVSHTITGGDRRTFNFSYTFVVRDDDNLVPTFAPGAAVPDQTWVAGVAIAALTLPRNARPGNGESMYTLTPTIPGLSLNGASGILTGTPQTDAVSTGVTYRVSDSDIHTSASDTDSLTFSVTIIALDLRPTVLVREGAQSSYAMFLHSYPGSDVTVTLSLTPTGGPVTLLTTSALTFTMTNFLLNQVVTVSAAQDEDFDDERATITHTFSLGGSQLASSRTTVVEVADDDTDLVPDFGGAMVESQTYPVTVAIPPLTLPAATSGNGVLSYTLSNIPPGLTFTPSTRTLTGTPTTMAAAVTLTYTVSDTDVSTGATDQDTLTFTVTVARPPGVAFVQAENNIMVREGSSSSSYRVVLTARPTGDVTLVSGLSVTSSSVSISPTVLTFTPANWNMEQQVFITAAEDDDARNERVRVTYRVSGYGSVTTSPTFTIFVDDDEVDEARFDDADGGTLFVYTVGTSITALTLPEATSGVAPLTYSLRINAQGSARDPSFFGLNFDPNTRTLSGTPTRSTRDPGSSNPRERLAVEYIVTDANGDTDTLNYRIDISARPGVFIGTATLSVAEGDTNTYTVNLASEPAGVVTLTPTVMPAGELTGIAVLTFTVANWYQLQTVTVTAVGDADLDDDTATITHMVSGYGTVTADPVTVTVTDTTPGVLIGATALTVDEGTMTTYTVVLHTAPAGNVIVTPASSGGAVTVSGALTFSATNWNTVQRVTVSAVTDMDFDDATVTITHSVSGYGSVLTAPSVMVEVIDEEFVAIGFERSRYLESEGTGTFPVCVVVTSPAAGDPFPAGTAQAMVTSSIEASNDAETGDFTAVSAALTFSGSVRRQCIDVALTGDTIPEDDETFTLTLTSDAADPDFDVVLSTATAVVTIDDDDDIVMQFSQESYEVSEEAGTLTFTIEIVSPAEGAVIERSDFSVFVNARTGSGDTAMGTGASRDFVARSNVQIGPFGNTVRSLEGSVNIIDDSEIEDAETFTLESVPPPGPRREGVILQRSSVTVTIAASDQPGGVTIEPTALTVEEGTDTSYFYTVVLQSAPTGAVTVTPTVPAELTAVPTALTFSTTRWNTRQTVTVSAVDDDDSDNATVTITHSVSGYGSVMDVPSVTVEVIDEEPVTIGFERSRYLESEETGTFQVCVTVTSPAAGDPFPAGTAQAMVTSSIEDSNDAEAGDFTAVSAALTFSSGSARRQCIDVALTDDNISEGTETFTLTLTSDATNSDFDVALSTATAVVSIVDDDPIRMQFSEASYDVSEGDGTVTFTIEMISPDASVAIEQPDFSVAVSASADTSDSATAGTDFETFEGRSIGPFGHTQRSQTFEVRILDDADTEGAETFSLWLNLDPRAPDVNLEFPRFRSIVTIAASDQPEGVTIAPTALTVEEGAGTVYTYTVVLQSAPTGAVTVMPTVPAELTAVPTALTFSVSTWNTHQTVTVTAAQDADASDDTVTITHTVAGYGSAAPSSVTVTVTDDDTAGVTIAPTTLTVDEGAATTYTVVLDTEPAGDVTVTPVLPAELTNGAALTFGVSTWNTRQTVTVTAAQDDSDTTDDTVTITHTVTGYGSVASPTPVTVVVDDNDAPGVTIAPTTLAVDEGAEATYTVVLQSAPTGAATVTPTVPAELTAVPTALTFSASTWNTRQTVTVAAAQDADASDDTVTITHAVAGYSSAAAPSPVTVTVTDDDTAGVTIAPTTLTVDEGAATTYTVVLDTEPAGDVTVTPVLPAELTNGAALTFGVSTWNTRQTVTVTAAQDDSDTTDDTVTITHTVTGYGSVASPTPVTVVVDDNDAPGVTIAPTTLAVDEGAEATYTVVLNTVPAGDVTVTLTIPAGLTTGTAALTFSVSTWDTHQTVTVAAAQDDDGRDDTATITHTVGGYGSINTADSVTVTVTDDETDEVTITPTTLAVAEGETATYRVVLTTRPAGDVIVALGADDGGAVTVPGALTFTAATWNTMQTVSVGAAQDDDGRDETVTITHTVTGYGSVPTPSPVTVTVSDDETEGVTITPTTLAVDEGAGATYTVVLDTEPAGDVTVTPALPAELTTGTTALTFSATTWRTPQTVTVAAVQDDDAEDATVAITHTITGYGVDTLDSITVTVTDDDTPGVTITPTALSVEEGSRTIYTVVLDTRPAGDVRVTPVVPAELTTSTPVLIFGVTTWRTVQTVTVAALTDADGDDATATITHTVSGYGSIRSAGPVTVTINDPDDTAKESIADLNRLILPELTRAMADQGMNAISQRIRRAGSRADGQLTIGGQSTMAGMLTTHGRAVVEGNLDMKTLLGGSNFVLPLGASAAGRAAGLSGVTLWGGGDYHGLSGKGDAIDWDGNLFSARVGADTRLYPNLLAGVAVSWSEADLDYDYGATFGTGDYEVALTSVNPYLGWTALNGRLDMWATAGYGWGELAVISDEAEPASSRASSDVTMQTLGAGGSAQLLEGRLTTVRVKGEALQTTMDVDGGRSIDGVKVEARRIRLGVEASRTHLLPGGGQLIPTVEVGMRHDAGDGRTGTGAEVGGGMRYINASNGLTIESHGRVLLGHGGGYEDWGIGGSVRLDVGQDGQGLSFSLQPTWGATASRVAQVWAQEAAATVSESAASRTRDGRVDLNLGYGLGWAEALVTPYGRLTLTNSQTRAYRLGSRVRLGNRLLLNLEGTRQETAAQPVDHGILIQIGLGF